MIKIEKVLNDIKALEEQERNTADNDQLMELGVRIKRCKDMLVFNAYGIDYAHFLQEDLHLDRRWIQKNAIPAFVEWINDLYKEVDNNVG